MLAHTFYGAGGSGGFFPFVSFGVRKNELAAPTRPVRAVCADADPSTTASQMMAETASTAKILATISVRVMSCMSGTGLSPWRVPKKCKSPALLFGRRLGINRRRWWGYGPVYGLRRLGYQFGEEFGFTRGHWSSFPSGVGHQEPPVCRPDSCPIRLAGDQSVAPYSLD